MAKDFVQKFATLITGAFSFLAALAWNDTIKTFIQQYISPGSTMKSMLYYALFVTFIAIIVSYYIEKFAKAFAKKEQALEKKIIALEQEIIEQEKRIIKHEGEHHHERAKNKLHK